MQLNYPKIVYEVPYTPCSPCGAAVREGPVKSNHPELK